MQTSKLSAEDTNVTANRKLKAEKKTSEPNLTVTLTATCSRKKKMKLGILAVQTRRTICSLRISSREASCHLVFVS